MTSMRFILLLICFVYCRFSISQTNDIEIGEFFYYECQTVSDRHYNSWLLSGVSKKKIIKKLNYDSEDLFVKSFIHNTHYLDIYLWPSTFMLRSHKELFNNTDFESVNLSIKDKMDNAKFVEYQINLKDSTKLYISVYRINGSFFVSQYFQWCSRNPPTTYYDLTPQKNNYYLYSLNSSKGLKLTKKEIKHIKEITGN